MPNDNSGAMTPAPAASAAPAANGGITLNSRNVILLVTFLTGGGLASGGLSIASNPAAEVSELREDIKGLGKQIEAVALSIADIKGDLKADRRDIDDLKRDVKEKHSDHEKRIRELERE